LSGEVELKNGHLPGYDRITREVAMAQIQIKPQVEEVIEKALAFSTENRGSVVSRLLKSLDAEVAEGGVEAAWAAEVKSRVNDIRSGKVKTIQGKEVLRSLAEEFPDEE
jgi:putative addiction module component (TIGR02574 family)